jgi:hypothetical protein
MRDALAFLLATLFLVGAPAFLLLEELRDPSCAAEPAPENPGLFRSAAVEDHRIARCLAPSADDGMAFVAAGPRDGGPLPDRTW